ncbi:MAG: hypothetical protein JWL94_318 [Microbacteriaceae bacterium]|jgi:hypothetical protein|nr:hypothetical protein [Microbacteriaceae bacterium]HEV7956070.1 hypothetical protein [Marisediminicola sp.]
MPTTGWREPTSSVPLRFGSYRYRYLGAVAALFVGGAALQFASVYTLPLALFGVAATVAGWVLVPAPGWRRFLAVGPALLGVASLLAGAQSGALLTLTLAAWLVVRMRPLHSFIVLLAPIAASLVLSSRFPQYGAGTVVCTVMGLVLTASAWLALNITRRLFAKRRIRHSQNRGMVP